MFLTDELKNYFDTEDVELLRENLDGFRSDENPSFWQVVQENNAIKFELGYVEKGFLIDITLQNHSINKGIVKLASVISYSLIEKNGFFRIALFVSENRCFYYESSSPKRIEQLKRFGRTIEKMIRG